MITDMKEWKKKNKVDPRTKVFIVKGQKYPPLKEALFETLCTKLEEVRKSIPKFVKKALGIIRREANEIRKNNGA